LKVTGTIDPRRIVTNVGARAGDSLYSPSRLEPAHPYINGVVCRKKQRVNVSDADEANSAESFRSDDRAQTMHTPAQMLTDLTSLMRWQSKVADKVRGCAGTWMCLTD